MKPAHDGLAWDGPDADLPTVALLRGWLADKPDEATVDARDHRIWVNNFGERATPEQPATP